MTKFDVPEGLEQDSLKALEISRNTGKVRRGTNEVTKVIEREKAKLVYLALDVQPPEIVAHLPGLCDEKKIPFTYVRAKAELGRASGIDVPTAAVAIVDPGKAKKEVADVVEKIAGIRTEKAPKEGDKPKAETPKEERPKPEASKEKKEEKPTGNAPTEKAEAAKTEEAKPEEAKPKGAKPKGTKSLAEAKNAGKPAKKAAEPAAEAPAETPPETSEKKA